MTRPIEETLIYPLDHDDLAEARTWVDRLAGSVKLFKIGYQLYYHEGQAAIEMVNAAGAEVFLDLKLHDIPRTVEMGVRQAVRMGVRIVNVHASGGRAMMEAAARAAAEEAARLNVAAPLVLGVTILTSLDDAAVREVGFSGRADEMVLRLADLANLSGLDGVVASAREAKRIRERSCPEFVILCPGIRPGGATADDQARVATVREAILAGADYLVVGRPIRQAPDPSGLVKEILADVQKARAEMMKGR